MPRHKAPAAPFVLPPGYEHRSIDDLSTFDRPRFTSATLDDLAQRFDGGCMLPRTAADAAPSLFDVFRQNESDMSGGIVLRGLRNVSATWASLAAFRAQYGELVVHERFEKRLPNHDGAAKLELSVAEYADALTNGSRDSGPVFEHHHRANERPETSHLFRTLSPEIAPPQLLAEYDQFRILSFGGAGMTVAFHNHEENWFMHAAGRKLWLIAPPHTRPPLKHGCQYFNGGADELPPHTAACTLHPGEIIFVKKGWWHATCNLDAWTAGYGAEGKAFVPPAMHPTILKAMKHGPTEALRIMPRARVKAFCDGLANGTLHVGAHVVGPLSFYVHFDAIVALRVLRKRACADAFDAKLDDLVCMAHQAELYWAEQGAPYFGLTMELLQWWRNRKGESRRKRPSCHRPGSWRTPAVCASPGACELWPGAVLALMDGNFSYGTRRRARAREPKCAST